MQLHRLRLIAIGPFADEVEIDFDRLSASGIFLLEGPTGAGKSTLIDAIVFALYGDVAGRASSSDRIASAVAPDGVTPSVVLDFSTGRGMFRVQRTPRHERRKRRGSGTTVEQASGKLWRLVSPDAVAGEPLSTRLDEIGAEIVDAVGLSREQFVQTVVLPQGEFATFLRADAEHRRRLLQRLFGTEVYDETVARLVESRRKAQQEREAAATDLLGAVRAYAGAMAVAGDDEESLVGLLDEDPSQLLVLVQEQLDDLSTATSKAESLVVECTREVEAAREALAQLRERDRLRRRALELRAALAELDGAGEAHAADVERAALAREAATLAPALVGLDAALARSAALDSALEAARADLPDASLDPNEWPARERQLNDDAVQLAGLVEVERSLAALATKVGQLEGMRNEDVRKRDELRVAVAQTPSEIADLREAQGRAAARAAQLASARLDLDRSQRLLEAARDRDTAMSQLADARAESQVAGEAARSAMEAETILRTRFLDGLAAQLVTELEPDHPCPVCGSREHPAPAVPADADVNRAAVDAAADHTAAATAAADLAAQAVAKLEGTVAELRGAAGSATTADAAQLVERARAEVSLGERATVDTDVLAQSIADAERALAEHRSALHESDSSVARLDAELHAVCSQIDAHREQLAAAAGDHESVAARAGAIRREASLWRAAIDAQTLVRASFADVRQRTAEVDDGVARSGFGDRAEVDDALMAEPDLQALVAVIEERRLRRAECESQLRSPELSGADLDEAIDLTPTFERLSRAESDLKRAQTAFGQLHQRLSGGRDRAQQLQTGMSAKRAVDEATRAVIRMADLASATTSDNARAMSLPTFVLRERFVEVVASANHRLNTMSDGRYRLEHVEDKRGNRKSGLELLVRDAHSERPREPATLSGGESFYCSLALALGLADVVTAEAGGVDLGTLFVDEGFGSLDPDTLDHVLEVLQGLTTSGRAVGIVSHVPELKEQVAERVSVVPNRDGSSHVIVAA